MKQQSTIQILGYVGMDPKVIIESNNNITIRFPLAQTNSFECFDNEENMQIKKWYAVRLTKQQLNLLALQSIQKGTWIYLRGTIQNNEIQTEIEKRSTEIIGHKMIIIKNQKSFQ